MPLFLHDADKIRNAFIEILPVKNISIIESRYEMVCFHVVWQDEDVSRHVQRHFVH